MTKEEAIEYFERSYTTGDSDDERQHNEALDMAISALKGFDGMTNGEVIQALFPKRNNI